ncbi:unnamed protein product [Calypogeia fissa]
MGIAGFENKPVHEGTAEWKVLVLRHKYRRSRDLRLDLLCSIRSFHSDLRSLKSIRSYFWNTYLWEEWCTKKEQVEHDDSVSTRFVILSLAVSKNIDGGPRCSVTPLRTTAVDVCVSPGIVLVTSSNEMSERGSGELHLHRGRQNGSALKA